MAFEELWLAKGTEKSQMVAGLNLASQKTAGLLELDDVVVKTSVGSHNGSFGIFMEKAKGGDAESWRLRYKPGAFPQGPFSPSQVKALADDDYAKVVGGLMRQSNRLEWFDLITGQGDRHGGNYFVEVDPKDFIVTLKAKNRVYGEAEWNDREKQKEIFRDPAEKAPYIERERKTPLLQRCRIQPHEIDAGRLQAQRAQHLRQIQLVPLRRRSPVHVGAEALNLNVAVELRIPYGTGAPRRNTKADFGKRPPSAVCGMSLETAW